MPRNRRRADTSVSLHPHSFDEAVEALARRSQLGVRICGLRSPAIPVNPRPPSLSYQRGEAVLVVDLPPVEPIFELIQVGR